MKKIIKPRQSGKTSELIKIAEETGAYILTPNRNMALCVSKLAEEQGHRILFPVTINEYEYSRFKNSHIHILIDDADMVLQQLFHKVTIDAITMSGSNQGKFEHYIDHTDCIWFGNGDNRCPSTCSQYRDGWNDAMEYIFKDGKGYQPYRREGSDKE